MIPLLGLTRPNVQLEKNIIQVTLNGHRLLLHMYSYIHMAITIKEKETINLGGVTQDKLGRRDNITIF